MRLKRKIGSRTKFTSASNGCAGAGMGMSIGIDDGDDFVVVVVVGVGTIWAQIVDRISVGVVSAQIGDGDICICSGMGLVMMWEEFSLGICFVISAGVGGFGGAHRKPGIIDRQERR